MSKTLLRLAGAGLLLLLILVAAVAALGAQAWQHLGPVTSIRIDEYGIDLQNASLGGGLLALFIVALVVLLLCTLLPLILLGVLLLVAAVVLVSVGTPLLAVLGIAALLLAPFFLIGWALFALLRRVLRSNPPRQPHGA